VNHAQATAILNRVREGQQFSHYVITRALELTGDYEEQRGSGVAGSIPQESLGGGQGRSPILVATDPRGHCQEARPSGC
jgi:ApbE superfamily uncharacterized protein (UPF0280 family)